jgi:hypothetical protein
MRLRIAFAFACVAAVAVGAQTSPSKPPQPKSLTLVGCVSTDDSKKDQVTFVAKDGTEYRLSGTDARAYAGQRVQIVGATNPNKVHFRGGLYPSPNAAGQAGAIDPAQAAMAAQGAYRGTGAAELPEFNVHAVKPMKGNCPPAKK